MSDPEEFQCPFCGIWKPIEQRKNKLCIDCWDLKQASNNRKNTPLSVIEADIKRLESFQVSKEPKDKILKLDIGTMEQLRIFKATQEILFKRRITFSDSVQILLDEVNRV